MPVHKAERLLNLIVMLLETTRPVGLNEIHATIPGYGQEQWDAFKRMFERDKDELREMGIPLERAPLDVWETEEGYRIPKDRYYLPELSLAPEELAALWLAAGLVRMKDPETTRSALLKLAPDAPVDETPKGPWLTADLSLAVPGLPKVFEAIAERKKLAFTYRSRGGEKDRKVDPYGLVHRKGMWYLVGLDADSNEVRSFRLDRMAGEARLIDPSKPGPEFTVPENFRPEAALDLPPFVQGPRLVQATVRFDATTAWWVERASSWLQLEPQDDGGAVGTVEVTDTAGFVSWLLSFGEGAELMAPPELRAETANRLAQMCD